MEDTYKKKRKHLLIIAGLTLFNIVIYNLFIKTGGYDIDGQFIPYDSSRLLKSSLSTFLFGLPILALIFGLIVSLIPYKNLSYGKKYFRSSVLSLLSINGLFTFGLVIIMIMTFAGLYPQEMQKEEKKVLTTQDFHSEFKILADSANYYFNLGIDEVKNGKSPSEVSSLIGPKLNNIKSKIDSKLQDFYNEAQNSGMNQDEYEKTFSELQEYITPLQNKTKELKDLGVEIK